MGSDFVSKKRPGINGPARAFSLVTLGLVNEDGDEVGIYCAHDPFELARILFRMLDGC